MTDSIDEAVRRHELALHELSVGRLSQALEACVDAVAKLEQASGHESLDVAVALNTLGRIREGLSEYSAAESDFERAWMIVAGSDSDDESMVTLRARTLGDRARLRRIQGRLPEAEHCYLQAMEMLRDGSLDLDILRNELAVVYKYAARFDEAEALYRQSLESVEAGLGPAHPEAATIWHNLGGLEHARGRYAEGEVYARRSVSIREAAMGADHPAVAADVAALAALVHEQGRLDEAETLYRRAVAIFETAREQNAYELAVNYNNLGALHYAREQWCEAEGYYMRALGLKEGLFGPDHPDIAMTLHNLAVLNADRGRNDEARVLYQRALAIFEDRLGPEHPKTRTCRRELTELGRGPEGWASSTSSSVHP
ncbi:tetratricopeptide repeat protein [Nocardia sp. GCM10030253]|uniref:tetratricopeptide repeat protein n=1 Tax=Nocardia sp. GCM10030253 TaxID=3273404 RepID=UPI0036302A05